MSVSTNRQQVIQSLLKDGKTAYGTFMMLQSGWAARIVGSVGWDVSVENVL
jgi:hypothetical protein